MNSSYSLFSAIIVLTGYCVLSYLLFTYVILQAPIWTAIVFAIFTVIAGAQLYLCYAFRKGIQTDTDSLRIPLIQGSVTLQSSNIQGFTTERNALLLAMDFASLKVHLKSGEILKFYLPDDMLRKANEAQDVKFV